ncbi:hypothetical protein SCHPADRAFT_896535 [Schizopora paradoxa]|uniref:Uncharacterized protein n=1 Tax=Schizopora paradoxa TaxID=27342 RepID=A0A0H2R6I6_9AGAM|nr:hypothetical protein SCHPADRAFT_896535 [Schizopora paradoxa]
MASRLQTTTIMDTTMTMTPSAFGPSSNPSTQALFKPSSSREERFRVTMVIVYTVALARRHLEESRIDKGKRSRFIEADSKRWRDSNAKYGEIRSRDDTESDSLSLSSNASDRVRICGGEDGLGYTSRGSRKMARKVKRVGGAMPLARELVIANEKSEPGMRSGLTLHTHPWLLQETTEESAMSLDR